MSRTSLIYALTDPSTGRPVYVGKTSMGWQRRLSNHLGFSRRHPNSTNLTKWIAEQLSSGARPNLVALETCPSAQSSGRERRWHSRLAKRFALLNQAPVGAGNPGVGRVQWTPDMLALLGTVPDSILAEKLGCERKTVSYRRECLGIPASFDRTRNTPPPPMGGHNRLHLDASTVALLGTMSDHRLAARSGTSKKRIMTERHRRGIASFATSTGEDGRIRKGEPHRRWTRPLTT